MNFFNRHDRFFQTSSTSPFPHRLDGRYQAVIEHCRSRIYGKRVLDIASHDGRWSYAALDAGACDVTGIEPRRDLIANAVETFDIYGVSPDRFRFICGDVFESLPGLHFDTVFCLGFYYHTARHIELMDLIERTGATFVVIDTEVVPGSREFPAASADPRAVFGNPCSVQFFAEPVDDQQMAVAESSTRNGFTLVGRPSVAAVELIAKHFGFRCTRFDWDAFFTGRPEAREWMVDYAEGWRETFYLEREDLGGIAAMEPAA